MADNKYLILGNESYDTQDYKQAFFWYNKAALEGDIEAQNKLGHMYASGKGTAPDLDNAVVWYERAAKAGNAEAQFQLANIYYFNFELKKTAIEWYNKASNQGIAEASFQLAQIFYNKLNNQKAAIFFEKSAEQGMSYSAYKIAKMNYTGDGIKKDLQKAIRYFKKAAELGDSAASKKLGDIYLKENDELRNYREAVYWYEKSMENSQDAEVSLKLASLYHNETYGLKDYKKAAYWYYMTAEYTYRDSPLLLVIAKLFDDEKSEIKDIEKAAFCYEKAAGAGCTEAQLRIGEIYFNNENYRSAITWFEKAARKGNDEKQNLLGHIYLDEKYSERDLDKSYYWFRLSAKNGNPDSQFYTGLFCYCGVSIRNNDNKAKDWWEKSVEQNYAPAKYCLALAFDMMIYEDMQNEILQQLKACIDIYSYQLFLDMLNKKKSVFQEKIQRAENLKNNLFTIKSVKDMAPFSIEKKWRHSMQLILTDNGVFIDNICAYGGHNWVEEIGKIVRAKCVHKYNHDWLVYINDEIEKKVNNDSNKKFEYDNKIVIDEVIAQRSISLEKGDCKFIKQDSTVILAQEKGMRNQSLPWANKDVKILVYERENKRLIDWEWVDC